MKTTGVQVGGENRNNPRQRFGIPEVALLTAGSQRVCLAGDRADYGTS